MLNKLLNRVGLGHKRPTLPLESTPANVASIIDVTDATFADLVLAADRLVVVDFWAEWCQPCQIMSAYVGFLAQEFGEQIVLAAMDVDENPETAPRYEIMGLPTLLFFDQGQVIDRVVGVEPYEVIRASVAQYLAEKNNQSVNQ
jgi:thioredoxin 1